MQEDFDDLLSSYATPSFSRYGSNDSGRAAATPSWMTEQRNKRRGRKYGRRQSRSFLSMDMETLEQDVVETKDDSNTSTVNTISSGISSDSSTLNNSTTVKSRYPRRSRSLRSSSPDLNSSIEELETKKPKKKRPNISNRGRPPLPSKGAIEKISGVHNGLVDASRAKMASTPFSKSNSIGSIATPSISRCVSTNNLLNNLDFSTPAANTRRRVLHRSQSAESNSTAAQAAASIARLLEENVHPNDTADRKPKATVTKPPARATPARTTRGNKKRTASTTCVEVKASPPKIPNRKTSTYSFSSTSFSSTGSGVEESFSNLARETPGWGRKRCVSMSYACKTPANVEHTRCHTFGSDDWNTQSIFSPMDETPMVDSDYKMESTPICLSRPSASSLFLSPTSTVRDAPESDNESMSSKIDDESSHSSSSESIRPERQQLSNSEIFSRKSSFADFKFLLQTLSQWSKTVNNGRIASMGLHNGCQIAVPRHWTYERRTKFVKWASTSFGFRVCNAGVGLIILRCVEREGLEILSKLKGIMEEYKNGNYVKKEESVKTLSPVAAPKSSTCAILAKIPSAFPFYDDNEEDVLVESFEKQVNIQKAKKTNACNVPNLRRSISLQPLARAIRSPLPMMSRRLRLSVDSHDSNLTMDSDRKVARLPPPRLSTESAMSGTDFLSQIHGAGPLSPIADLLPRMRQRAGRMLNPKRPSLEKSRLCFDSCVRGGSKPYESPHPNNHCVVHNTPLPRADFGCNRPWETPMPKQIERWGSQPIAGRDWGDSVSCDYAAIICCTRVFAQSWFKSGFNKDGAMCDSYKISFPDDEQSSLHDCYNSDSDIENEEEYDAFEFSPEAHTTQLLKLHREDSVGGSALALLNLDDGMEETNIKPPRKPASRRSLKLRKYRRMSLCVSNADFLHPKRCIRLSISPKKQGAILPDASLLNDIVKDGPILTKILSFFNQAELLQNVSPVCTSWTDRAAEALGTLMIASVGCKNDINDEVETPRDELDSIDNNRNLTLQSSSIARSMEQDWSYFNNFSSGQFLSEGAFKKVFRVWNKYHGVHEALSVMDVEAISDTGNLHTVGAELAVSALLSSLTRRGISPNFVITRGVFTCQYDLGSKVWNEPTYNERMDVCNELERGECGNFQYIRMELCKHADAEKFIRKLPNNMLDPLDCRNILFQMAFALHVAGDKLGMKHYDVKLLNFFLQSALDDSTPEDIHPDVVLRYGIGSSVFRFRMTPSTAFIVKLADYGTSVLRSDSDGQPISIGQFTTFENTPPDYLILGNDAKQGYGHDCFGLGLSMLHLFTGYCPYEEILKDVVCPDALKTKLRKIWNSSTHDIICSAMMYEDSNGTEVEDETFYDTLYRFIILFGMPTHKITYEGSGKVRRAINSTLLKEGTADSRVFESDRRIFSLANGSNEIISNARRRLEEIDGAMDLLLSLVCFDPTKRATPLDVINSKFMAGAREADCSNYNDGDAIVKSYMSYYSTK